MARRPSGKARARALVKALGDDRVSIHGSRNVERVRVLPTGIDCLDVAVRAGGYPYGRIIIVHGDEGTFKTTLGWHAIASAQQRGGIGIYQNYERKLDLMYAQAIGVNMDELVLHKPRSLEAGFHLMETSLDLIRDGDGGGLQGDPDCPIIIVYDSIHAAKSGSAFNVKSSDRQRKGANKYEDSGFDQQALKYAECVAKFVPALDDTSAILLAISQIRIKMDDMRKRPKIAIGKAWAFYASMAISVEAKAPAKRAGKKVERTGDVIEALVTKNQVGTPYGRCAFSMTYGLGADIPNATLHAAVKLGIMEQSGSWYTFELAGKGHKFHGMDGMNKIAEKEPEVFAALREKIARWIIGDKT